MAKSDSKITTLDNTDTPIVATATPAEAVAIQAANHDSAMSGKKRVITIHPSEADGGNDAVFLQLNGYAYQIPRGIPVLVPEEVIEVLNNAKQTFLSFGQGGAVTERTANRFAFSAN